MVGNVHHNRHIIKNNIAVKKYISEETFLGQCFSTSGAAITWLHFAWSSSVVTQICEVKMLVASQVGLFGISCNIYYKDIWTIIRLEDKLKLFSGSDLKLKTAIPLVWTLHLMFWLTKFLNEVLWIIVDTFSLKSRPIKINA